MERKKQFSTRIHSFVIACSLFWYHLHLFMASPLPAYCSTASSVIMPLVIAASSFFCRDAYLVQQRIQTEPKAHNVNYFKYAILLLQLHAFINGFPMFLSNIFVVLLFILVLFLALPVGFLSSLLSSLGLLLWRQQDFFVCWLLCSSHWCLCFFCLVIALHQGLHYSFYRLP